MGFIDVKNLLHQFTRYTEDDQKKYYTVLSDVNLTIEKGDYIGILGRNGSGKTTLARHLCALLQPTEGEVWVDGLSVAEDPMGIHRKAGMVFQNPDNQIVGNTVEEDIAFGMENIGVPAEEMNRRITDVLKGTSLEDHRLSSPEQLSGGQKQKLAVAGVLAMEPECIVFDEPTSMIDPESRKELLYSIRQLNKKKKITVIYITHHIEEVENADYLYIMNDGRVAARGEPDYIHAHPEILRDNGLWLDETDIKPAVLPMTDKREGICLQNVSYSYEKHNGTERKAVNQISLQIRRGEAVAVIGKTGSGKSTLLQIMCGLFHAKEGNVILDGEDILQIPKKRLCSKIGICFQYPEYQLFEETVMKDAAFGPENLGVGREQALKQAKEALAKVRVPETLFDANPLTLSGGEKRKVAIAGILAMEPDFLLLDEPTAGLDYESVRELFRLLYELQKGGTGIVFVTHDIRYARMFADRILVMEDGSLTEGVESCFGK